MRPPSSILPLLAAVGITVAAPFNPEIKWGGDGWTGRKVAVHFPANIPESLIRHAAYAATDYDSWVFDFHMDKGNIILKWIFLLCIHDHEPILTVIILRSRQILHIVPHFRGSESPSGSTWARRACGIPDDGGPNWRFLS